MNLYLAIAHNPERARFEARLRHGQVDSPDRVDAIVVVAGAADERYKFARHLAKIGVVDRILVSQPAPGGRSSYDLLRASLACSPLLRAELPRVRIRHRHTRPLSKSRKDALLNETGGYIRALLRPAC